MTRFLEQKKKDYYCTTPHCSKKKQNVKVKMQKTPLTLKHSLKFSALNCVTKTFLKLRLAEGTYFIRNQFNYRKKCYKFCFSEPFNHISVLCTVLQNLSNTKDKYDKLFRLSQDASL